MDIDHDEAARAYTQHRGPDPAVLAALIAVTKPGSMVLEVGCATANYLSAVARETGCACWGVEQSEQMRTHAANGSFTILAGDAEHLQFANDTFDLVYSVDVIHHLGNRDEYFREVARVLRPGGRVCTVTDSEDDIRGRRPLSVYFPETVAIDVARYPSTRELDAAITAAGLTRDGLLSIAAPHLVRDIAPYRDRAYSCLHLIGEEAHREGLRRMEEDLALGPIEGVRPYTLYWASKPDVAAKDAQTTVSRPEA
jgi:SAM-dependent methyltransferase